ncbi:hypothetical protein ACFRJ1_37335 [Streptomyces sp. NPDC056773]|uniref:hypothetical protein n=1 Tax=unclassified Streptomyces TaxID=2593676 RepID=UPI003684B80F
MEQADRESRRLAWCVALLLRHAPDDVASGLLARLDAPTRRFLCRDQDLTASAVTLLLRHGTDEDRHTIARNPEVLGRPLPGLPGARIYAAGRTPTPGLLETLAKELGRPLGPPLTSEELIGLLRLYGSHRPRVPLDVLSLPHTLDHAVLLREHARAPLPPGSVEALLLTGGLPLGVCLALLDTRAAVSYGRWWGRPAVRAVRMGLATMDELVAHVAPAHRTLLLTGRQDRDALRWCLQERTELRSAVTRVLRPVLGDDPRLWAELLRHAPGFPGTLPELARAVAAGTVPAPAAAVMTEAAGPRGFPGIPGVHGLTEAVESLAAGAAEPPGSIDRELALAGLSLPLPDLGDDISAVRHGLAEGLLTGTDVLRHKVPASWALDPDQWLGRIEHPDRNNLPGPVLAAAAEADRLFAAALGTDAEAWWRAARALPAFAGTLPELLAVVIQGDSVSKRP